MKSHLFLVRLPFSYFRNWSYKPTNQLRWIARNSAFVAFFPTAKTFCAAVFATKKMWFLCQHMEDIWTYGHMVHDYIWFDTNVPVRSYSCEKGNFLYDLPTKNGENMVILQRKKMDGEATRIRFQMVPKTVPSNGKSSRYYPAKSHEWPLTLWLFNCCST